MDSFDGLKRNVVHALGGFWMALILISLFAASLGAILFFAPIWMRWGLLLPLLSRIFVVFAAEKRPWQQLSLALLQLLLWPGFWIAAIIAYQTNQLRWKDRPVN